MPTAYTAKLYKEPQEFAEFVLTCSRQFGALAHMEDQPLDAPIPDVVLPSEWAREKMEAKIERRTQLLQMTEEEADAAALAEYQERLQASVTMHQEWVAASKRFQEMYAKVQAWVPPTDEHQGLKKDMLRQLDYHLDYPGPPPTIILLSGSEWRAEKLSFVDIDIGYYGQCYEDAKSQAQQATEWIRALKNSLKEAP